MVEIRYGDQYEVTDLAGQTVSEAREQFRAEFGIPDKARAKLNGRNIKGNAEPDMVLNDDDKLSFAAARSRAPFLVGALLLALAATGGVFAFGFINASTTITATIASNNFADVSANSTGIADIQNVWSGFGFFKGSIAPAYPNGAPIFNVDTLTSGYEGDLVVTVSLGNADKLVKHYRALALKLAMADGSNDLLDINSNNGTGRGGDVNDWVMLTLDNGGVSMFPKGTTNGDNMTVKVLSGFYITHVFPFGSGGSSSPDLFCEVAQR